MSKLFLFLAIVFGLHTVEAKFLSGEEIVGLVSGNTEIGYSSRTQVLYELHFYRDGCVDLRRGLEDRVYQGTWKVEGDTIISKWPEHSGDKEFTLRYFALGGNVYRPCSARKEKFFNPFVVIPGHVRLQDGQSTNR